MALNRYVLNISILLSEISSTKERGQEFFKCYNCTAALSQNHLLQQQPPTEATSWLGSISAALSCLVCVPPRPSGEERGLLSRTAVGDRAYLIVPSTNYVSMDK